MILDAPLPGIGGGTRFNAIRRFGMSGLCRSRGSLRNSSPAGRLHYVVQDQPEGVADLLERHASPHFIMTDERVERRF